MTTLMTSTTPLPIEEMILARSQRLDCAALCQRYADQDEFLILERFLPEDLLAQWDAELELLKPHIHRNFIPKHKKGGSVGYDTVQALAPSINAVYQSRALLQLISAVARVSMRECPPSDAHRCALYSYTEEGDHIGWHYDTSYYKDRRWTLLVGLQDQSSSRLICRLHTQNPGHAQEELNVQVGRGTLVLFNGDKVYHKVTPLGAGEHRYIVTMQYVTSGAMNPFMRFVSNMKDSIAYFGVREVFLGRRGAKGTPPDSGTTPAR